jgi:site-specific DNA recombinase
LLAGRLADLQERIATAEQRLAAIDAERSELEHRQVTEADVARALADFEAVWDTLTPREQGELLRLLIERINYDGRDGTIAIGLRPNGIQTLIARANGETVK